MSNTLKIRPPEDTITQMARRAYTKFREAEMKVGARMAEWDNLPIRSQVNWKDIMAAGLGKHGTLVNCNPGLREPHTLVMTGLSMSQADAMRKGIESKLGGTVDKPAMTYSDRAFDAVSPQEREIAEQETIAHEPEPD